MDFLAKLRELVDKGVDVSAEFLAKAKAKAEEAGEKGALRVEIYQLEQKAKQVSTLLGAEVYHAFIEKGQKTITAESPAIRDHLEELSRLRSLLETKQRRLEELSDT
ncbi:hypothetical protein [Spirochaeta thermophila]|nr:hypothetical protein [Spirochaeta thermophila]